MNTLHDEFFDFIYGEALNDLNWRSSKDNTGQKKYFDPFIRNAYKGAKDIKKLVHQYIVEVIDGASPRPCLCDYAEEINRVDVEGHHLSFGNAQKLINLTVKYIYFRYYNVYRDNFRCCHVPMDDYMRDYVARHCKGNDELVNKFKGKAWSGNDSKEAYCAYQNAIAILIAKSKTDCIPIEFDYLNWEKAKNNPEEDPVYSFKP